MPLSDVIYLTGGINRPLSDVIYLTGDINRPLSDIIFLTGGINRPLSYINYLNLFPLADTFWCIYSRPFKYSGKKRSRSSWPFSQDATINAILLNKYNFI